MRRSIPGKLLVREIKDGSLIILTEKSDKMKVSVVNNAMIPDEDVKLKSGDILTIVAGGQKVVIDGIDMLLIDYKQILYIY